MADLKLTNIRKDFGANRILDGIDLTVRHGEFVVFVGPSGCGKSTMLRIIAGLERVSEGTVEIDGRDVTALPASERGLAMVFQSYALYPHMTVYANMAFALENMAMARDEIDRRVRRAADMLQLSALLDRKPGALSGGQRQRVAIGRAIVRDPAIFLFDEPLSNLDAELRVATRKELAALHGELGGTVIYVTHDQVEAMTLAHRIVVLNRGKIEQVGAPLELYNRPDNLFVAGFIGSPRMNFLPAVADGQGGVILTDGATIVLPEAQGLMIGAKVTLGVRPEHLDLVGASDADLTFGLDLIEQLGGETCLYASRPGLPPLTVRVEGQCALARGADLPVRLRRDHIHLFDPSGRARRLDTPATETLA